MEPETTSILKEINAKLDAFNVPRLFLLMLSILISGLSESGPIAGLGRTIPALPE